MAWTEADLVALKAAIASGVKVVQYGDQSITYQDDDSMRKSLRFIENELAKQAGNPTSGRTILVQHGRGA